MFRINIFHIVKDHFRSLRLEGENHMHGGDKIVFIGFSLVITIGLIHFDISLKSQVGNLIKAMAIFGAFLFNLLAIIHGQLKKIKEEFKNIDDNEIQKLKVKFAKEIHSNITFAILLSIASIFFLLVYDLTPEKYELVNLIILKTSLAINYFLLILFGLTLLMAINRVYILIRHEEE